MTHSTSWREKSNPPGYYRYHCTCKWRTAWYDFDSSALGAMDHHLVHPMFFLHQTADTPNPRPMVPAGDAFLVISEQLEDLIEHGRTRPAVCECGACKRLEKVRELLLQVFDEPKPVLLQMVRAA